MFLLLIRKKYDGFNNTFTISYNIIFECGIETVTLPDNQLFFDVIYTFHVGTLNTMTESEFSFEVIAISSLFLFLRYCLNRNFRNFCKRSTVVKWDT